MGRDNVSEPQDKHRWLLREIDEINAMPRGGWDQMQKSHNRSLLAKRRNLRRLIELAVASSRGGWSVGHTVYDAMLIEINSKFEVEIVLDGLIRRIIEEKVPIGRLRICPACKDIFWMKTKRSKTCGSSEKKCSDRAYYQDKKRA